MAIDEQKGPNLRQLFHIYAKLTAILQSSLNVTLIVSISLFLQKNWKLNASYLTCLTSDMFSNHSKTSPILNSSCWYNGEEAIHDV